MNAWARAFPYIRDRRETPEQQLARLRAEGEAVLGAPYANDNAPEREPEPREPMWWQRD